jgi:hypothetical protein
VDFADEVLRLLEVHRQGRQRPGRDDEDLVEQMAELARNVTRRTAQRLLSLAPAGGEPSPKDRAAAREQLPLLLGLTSEQRAAVVNRGRDYQAWALSLEASEAALAAVDLMEATRLTRLAAEMAQMADDAPQIPKTPAKKRKM